MGAIQGKVGRIQVLAGLAPPSQTVVCNIRALRSHQRWLLPPLEAEIGGKWQKTYKLVYLDPKIDGKTVIRFAPRKYCLTCPDRLGQYNTNRIISICVIHRKID